ncbi:MAG: TetR/AcrR family transcriptional regulator [Betaproteobacteria bacterium]|jgi:AcrR family transcriptional regulator|nr:TetR/AcrR family transcriptional regulator [Betaproteobacteria bacterium]
MARPEDPARRRGLVAAAAGLFRRYGYERTTAREIARAFGVQSGSIFYHFENKEALLVAVMLEGMRQFVAAARGPLADAHSPLERLRALFYGHLTALHGGGDEQAVVIQEWRSLSARPRKKVVAVRDAVEAMWREVLDEAAAAGLVSGDLRLLRLAMLGALNWTLQWYQPDGPLGVRELADGLLAVFVPAAGRRAGRPERRVRQRRALALTRGTSSART